jgi:hypothetical protein
VAPPYDQLQQRNWYIFPLKPNSKTPLVRDWENWATTTPDPIWWSDPNQGYGIACGPSQLYVIDIDHHHTNGYHTWFNHPDRTAHHHTGCAATTPGGGLHLYYHHPNPPPNTTSRIGPGVDTRGTGGYVVGYPLDLDGQPAPLPDWITNLLTTPTPKPTPTQPPKICEQTTRFGHAALNDETTKIKTTPPGSRNSQLNESAYKIAQLVAGGEIEHRHAIEQLVYAATTAGLGEHETSRTIESAFRAGTRTPRSSRR